MSRNRYFITLAIVSLIILSGTSINAGYSPNSFKEGAYACREESGAVDECWNFLKNFTYGGKYYYEQYYWAYSYLFTTSNNSYVDAMDYSFFSGHGSNFYITTYKNYGDGVNFASGSASLGDNNLEELTIDACSVAPSPIERSDWASGWWTTFHYLHQILSFRTTGWFDGRVEDKYSKNLIAGQKFIDAWFNAANSVRNGMYPGYCAVVWATPQSGYAGAQNDTYYKTYNDPPYNLGWLSITYQY